MDPYWSSVLALFTVSFTLGACVSNWLLSRRLGKMQADLIRQETDLYQRHAEIIEIWSRVRLLPSFDAQQALFKIQQIEAGLSGISRPLIRSLRNTIEPQPVAQQPLWWGNTGGFMASQGAPFREWPEVEQIFQRRVAELHQRALSERLLQRLAAVRPPDES